MENAPKRIWIMDEKPATNVCWRDNVFFTDVAASECYNATGMLIPAEAEYHRADMSADLARAALEAAATRARDWVHGDAIDMPADTGLWDYIMAADPAAIVAQVMEKE